MQGALPRYNLSLDSLDENKLIVTYNKTGNQIQVQPKSRSSNFYSACVMTFVKITSKNLLFELNLIFIVNFRHMFL